MYCMEILTIVGVRCHSFGGESVKLVTPNCHGIMMWLNANLRWIARKPAQALPSTLY